MKFVSAKDGNVIIENMDMPKLNDGDILVKMKACSICGSDLEKLRGGYGKSMRLGHEIAGEVVETRNQKFAKGDRVYVHHHVPCYECYYCKKEDYVLCDEYMKSNVEPCGLSEYIRVPKWNVDKDGVINIHGLGYDEAALIEPFACCLKSVNKLKARKDDVGCVIGCGPVGMMHMMLLDCKKIFAVDISDYRLNFAKKYAETIYADNVAETIKRHTNDIGADFVVVATGNVNAVKQAFEIVRKGGKIMIFGVPPKDAIIDLDLNRLFFNEVSILTSGYCSEVETNNILKMIEEKKINAKSLITHSFPLEKSAEAFELAKSGNAMKIVITE
ncbi:MAG: alcohol dehydrogenase catalytic domain-containing protein [Candidatus Aenigmatarchaeota archaeon]